MKILFLSSSGQSSCLDALREELESRGHSVTHIVNLEPYKQKENLRKLAQEKYDAIVITDSKFKQFCYFAGNKLGKIYLVPHGVGIKFRRNFLDSYFEGNAVDVIFPGGPVYLPTLQKHIARKKDIMVYGFPKTDFTVNHKNHSADFKAEFEKQYSFDPAKKTVLYAPTWSRHEYSYGTLKYFREFYGLLHQTHNIILAPHSSDFAWFNKTFSVAAFEQFCYYMEFNKNRAILAADVVVSDNSSIALEAALIGKPIVHLINAYAPETMHLYLEPTAPTVQVGEILQLPQDLSRLRDAVVSPSKDKNILKEKARWVQAFCAGCTGDSAKRIVDTIERG
jgi:ADP-heptose:LPS heptosyltransferase